MSVLIDAIGTHHVPVPKLSDGTLDCRIVSLVPSLTELLCDLGLTTSLVGRTGFCIHPEQQLAPIPKIGGTKDVNIEKIRKLAPTHLIVNIDENEKPTVDTLATYHRHTSDYAARQSRFISPVWRSFSCARKSRESM